MLITLKSISKKKTIEVEGNASKEELQAALVDTNFKIV